MAETMVVMVAQLVGLGQSRGFSLRNALHSDDSDRTACWHGGNVRAVGETGLERLGHRQDCRIPADPCISLSLQA